MCLVSWWSALAVRVRFSTLAATAFGLVLFGLQLQAMLNLSPCPLCIFQRLLVLSLGSLALMGFLCPRLAWGIWGTMLLLALGGMAVAGYQSWMQMFPHLAAKCSYSDPNLIEQLVDMLGMQWPKLFLATGFCESREWVWLGLSLANWAFVAFSGFATAAWLALRGQR